MKSNRDIHSDVKSFLQLVDRYEKHYKNQSKSAWGKGFAIADEEVKAFILPNLIKCGIVKDQEELLQQAIKFDELVAENSGWRTVTFAWLGIYDRVGCEIRRKHRALADLDIAALG